jgi:GR25 family glycosyltransferase involved in LPS biosynthesis
MTPPFYYLAMERMPERCEHMQAMFEKTGITNIVRVECVDGLLLDAQATLAERSLFLHGTDFHGVKENIYVMANAMSHLRTLQQFYDTNEDFAVILQNDMYLVDNIAEEVNNCIENFPEDAQFVFISHAEEDYKGKGRVWSEEYDKLYVVDPFGFYDLMYAKRIKTKVNEYVGRIEQVARNSNSASGGYIISREGAKNFVAACYTHGVRRAMDWTMNEYAIHNNIYYGSNTTLSHPGGDFEQIKRDF